jgi:hypothetical protein
LLEADGDDDDDDDDEEGRDDATEEKRREFERRRENGDTGSNWIDRMRNIPGAASSPITYCSIWHLTHGDGN